MTHACDMDMPYKHLRGVKLVFVSDSMPIPSVVALPAHVLRGFGIASLHAYGLLSVPSGLL